MTEPTAEPSKVASSAGINITDAVNILSTRQGDEPPKHADSTGCPCHRHAPEEAKSMGQTIDLMQTSNVESDDNSKTINADNLEETRQNVERERSERNVKIRQHLETMSVAQLVNAVLEAQRERVVTYREYDRGLETVLETGNMSNYPNVCANATASFAVLSDTINAIRVLLNKEELADLLEKLQKCEQEKLRLTAALHLERLRERNEELNDGGGANNVSKRLLQEGVSSLRTKMAECVEAINDVLEELRYALAEQEDNSNAAE